MADDTILVAMIRELTRKVDEQAATIAVLMDRRGDAAAADVVMGGLLDKLSTRVTTLETESATAKGRSGVITAMVGAGSGAAGIGAAKLLSMLAGS